MLTTVLHQLDQKIIYPHYDFKHLTEKYFEIGMKLNDFSIQLVKYCNYKDITLSYIPVSLIHKIKFNRHYVLNLLLGSKRFNATVFQIKCVIRSQL